MLTRWIFLWVFGATVTLLQVAVGITGWWTLSGHCCGSPLLGVAWDNCLPVQDKYWLTKILSPNTHCDDSWRRVPERS